MEKLSALHTRYMDNIFHTEVDLNELLRDLATILDLKSCFLSLCDANNEDGVEVCCLVAGYQQKEISNIEMLKSHSAGLQSNSNTNSNISCIRSVGSNHVQRMTMNVDVKKYKFECYDIVSDHKKSLMLFAGNIIHAVLCIAHFQVKAMTDSLTQLPNKSGIDDEVRRLRKKMSHDKRIAVCLCDVDAFKHINEKYGHLQGNFVLKEFGKLLSTSLRRHVDVVGRFGGDEFQIIVCYTDIDKFMNILNRLRNRIQEHAFLLTRDGVKEPVAISASFGVCFSNNQSNIDVSKATAVADIALYEAKRSGGNTIKVKSFTK